MKKEDLNSSYAKLIADVREYVEYQRELGIASLEVDLPKLNVEQSVTPRRPYANPPREKLEKFIQPVPPPERIEIPERINTPPARPPRRDIFKSAKLSEMDSIRAKAPNAERKDISKIEMMPEKKTGDEQVAPKSTEVPGTSGETLATIHSEIGRDCSRCRLCEKRTQVVNSVGNPNADLMFVGEAPGADEDEKGEPFVGRAGKLLTKMIEGIDIKREDVFIGNINRCRPPANRQPQADEAEVCRPFLLREISVVRPKVIIVMGNTACQNLLNTKTGITKLRGTFQDYHGVKVMPTFHPAYLLRDPRKKREVWEDLKTVRAYLAKQ